MYLFDIDGTLIGGDGAGRRAFERACADVLGVERALEGLTLDGMTDPLILEHVFATHLRRARTADESSAVLATYVRHLEVEIRTAAYHVKPAVEETLERLEARGACVGLATGNLAEGARIKLTRGGLWSRFPFGGFGSDAGDRAELVRVAIARGRERMTAAGRESAREEIVVIGDTPRDIDAAHAAGAVCVAVATGRHSVEELRAAGADAAFPSLREYLAVL
ncbi:MAG TPA: HAD hydrolase-like protein [Polyangia bacterium]|nr:HAD hydrolase-like protein [Polyangia bacterium]